MTLLRVPRGDRAVFEIAVTDENGTAVSLAGKTLYFTAKTSREQDDADAPIAKEIGDGITVTSEAGGLANITINPEDTGDFLASTVLRYDVELRDDTDSQDVSTIVSGNLLIEADVRHGTVSS